MSTVALISVHTLRQERHDIALVPPSAVPVPQRNDSDQGDVNRDIATLRASVLALSTRIDATEKEAKTGNQSAWFSAIDSNIETVLKSATNNAQDVQKLQRQLNDLARASHGAFNAVAEQLQSVKVELEKNVGKK